MADRMVGPLADKQQLIRQVLAEPRDSALGRAIATCNAMRLKPGFVGFAGAAAGTMIVLSGLPAVERSAAELGARMGLGDTPARIALAAARLALYAAVIIGMGLLVTSGLVALVYRAFPHVVGS